jgi:hypothetical protein
MALVVPIVADTSGLVRGLNHGTSGLRKFGKMAALVGGAAALGGLVATLKIGVDEFMGAQKVLAQTGAVLKSTGGAAKVTSKQITTMSESLMKLSGIDDEAIQSGQNLLLTFTKIRNETGKGNNIFDQATLAMTNLSVAMGKDLSSSAILVGKALNDPVKGVGALSRAGVQFTASQKDTIKALVESGNVMGAQKMILKELETQFGGSAKAAGQTLPGQLNILKETFRNLAADLIAGFIPAVSRGAEIFLGFVRDIAKQPTLSAKIQFIIGTFAGAAWRGVQSIIDWWTTPKKEFEKSPTSGLHIKLIPAGQDQVAAFFTSLNTAMKQKANEFGNTIGFGIMDAIFGGAKSQAGKNAKKTLGLFVTLLNPVALNEWAGGIGRDMITGLWDGITRWLNENPGIAVEAIKNWFMSAGDSIGGVIGAAFKSATKNARSGAPAFIGVITKTVRDAVTAARQGLAGLGSTLGGLLSEITGTSSPEAKQAAAIRAQQKADAAAREKTRLESAVATAQTDDEKKQAQQDLNDFLLEQEATRLEDSVAQQQSANQRAIDDLIAEFNRGDLAARDFRTRLDAIIGGASGTDLGMAFADGFTGAFDQIINAVKDLAGVQKKVGGREIKPVAGTPAAEAARAAHAEWKAARAERLKSARDARRTEASDGGTKITDAEQTKIDSIMKAYDKANPEPVRMAAGGILKRQVFTAGEAGREAVIPLGSSEAMGIMRDALGGGGGTTYNLVINAGLGTNPDELGRVIVESIKKFEKRNGQVFAGPQIQATSAGVSTNGGTQSRSLRMG